MPPTCPEAAGATPCMNQGPSCTHTATCKAPGTGRCDPEHVLSLRGQRVNGAGDSLGRVHKLAFSSRSLAQPGPIPMQAQQFGDL